MNRASLPRSPCDQFCTVADTYGINDFSLIVGQSVEVSVVGVLVSAPFVERPAA